MPSHVKCGAAILVYEDDLACAHAFAAVLQAGGHSVQITSHFQPALAALDAGLPIDLLLADIVMPGGVNGIALARMARMRRPSLKVIHVTGYRLGAAEQEARAPILRKPVPDELLLSEVRRALEAA